MCALWYCYRTKKRGQAFLLASWNSPVLPGKPSLWPPLHWKLSCCRPAIRCGFLWSAAWMWIQVQVLGCLQVSQAVLAGGWPCWSPSRSSASGNGYEACTGVGGVERAPQCLSIDNELSHYWVTVFFLQDMVQTNILFETQRSVIRLPKQPAGEQDRR